MKYLMSIITITLFVFCLPLAGQTVQIGDEAPDFSATTIRGNAFDLHDVVQDSIVVIYFMGYS